MSGELVCTECGEPCEMDDTPVKYGGVPLPQHRDARGSKTVECSNGLTWVAVSDHLAPTPDPEEGR